MDLCKYISTVERCLKICWTKEVEISAWSHTVSFLLPFFFIFIYIFSIFFFLLPMLPCEIVKMPFTMCVNTKIAFHFRFILPSSRQHTLNKNKYSTLIALRESQYIVRNHIEEQKYIHKMINVESSFFSRFFIFSFLESGNALSGAINKNVSFFRVLPMLGYPIGLTKHSNYPKAISKKISKWKGNRWTNDEQASFSKRIHVSPKTVFKTIYWTPYIICVLFRSFYFCVLSFFSVSSMPSLFIFFCQRWISHSKNRITTRAYVHFIPEHSVVANERSYNNNCISIVSLVIRQRNQFQTRKTICAFEIYWNERMKKKKRRTFIDPDCTSINSSDWEKKTFKTNCLLSSFPYSTFFHIFSLWIFEA